MSNFRVGEICDERGFVGWMERAKPGDRVIYHSGLLMADRLKSQRGTMRKHTMLDRLADRALASATTGRVRLFQRRIDQDFGCQYIAEKIL